MKVDIRNSVKVAQLANIFRHSKKITDVVNLDFTESGLHMQGMDYSHACLFELNLGDDWFDEYNVSGDFRIGICCEILFKIISCHEEGQRIVMSMDRGHDRLRLEFLGEGTIEKAFEIPLIDIISELMTIPDVDYTADVGFVSADLSALISQLSIFSDGVRFKFTEKGIDLIASGDHGKMTADIKEELINEYSIEEDATVSVSFGLSYIERVCAFSKLNKDVSVHCSLEYPMKIHYSLDDENESKNYMRFFIAPKADDDDTLYA